MQANDKPATPISSYFRSFAILPLQLLGTRSICYTYFLVTSTSSKLAIDGGTPVRSAPYPPWPQFHEAHSQVVDAVLRSGKVNYWTGLEGRAFEREFARQCQANHAVAVANGTVALELALHSLGIGPGDEVVTPCRSFVSSTSCIVSRGARPVFADVDRNSQNLTADTIRDVLTERTRAIVAVHLAGWSCDMDSIMVLAAERGLKVVEDCAQAQGARYHGQPVGSLGHAGAFSFCQDKIMTTGGEGGMLTTNDPLVWQRAWSYRDHGRDFAATASEEHSPGYRWLYHSAGTNWRMTEMQSALGRHLLKQVEVNARRRCQLAARLSSGFSRLPALRTCQPAADLQHAYYRCYVFVRPERLRPGWSRDRIMQSIVAEGVPCYTGGCPEIYRERAFQAFRPSARLPVATELGATSLAFLVHPTISEADISDTIEAVRKVMQHATAERDVSRKRGAP